MNKDLHVQQMLWRHLGLPDVFRHGDERAAIRARCGYFIVHRPLPLTTDVPKNYWCITHEPSQKRGGAVRLLADAIAIAEKINAMPCDWASPDPSISGDVKAQCRTLLEAKEGRYR